jgi:hypothetical protein
MQQSMQSCAQNVMGYFLLLYPTVFYAQHTELCREYDGILYSAFSPGILCTALYAILHTAAHRVIHEEENRITIEMEEFVMITTATKLVHEPYVPLYSTGEKQLKF